MSLVLYFWLFLKASLFSTGGMGNLPSLHRDLIVRRWAMEKQFAESLTIGQVAPGPNGLWVVSLGYLTHGLAGACLATIAVTLPPLLVILLDRIYRVHRDHPMVVGFVRGMSLAVVGSFAVVIAGMLASSRVTRTSGILCCLSVYLGATKRVSAPVIILGAALIGILVR